MERDGLGDELLWKHEPFRSRILNTIFDEGHSIVEWVDTFRRQYGDVGKTIYLLPGVPIYISSARIPQAMIPVLKEKFKLRARDYVLRKCSNDQHNIALTVIQMQHNQNSYENLAFLIPKNWRDGDPVLKKFMVFFDNKRHAEEAAEFLKSHISLELQEKLRWFHAGMTPFFKEDKISELGRGGCWGLCATDSGRMV